MSGDRPFCDARTWGLVFGDKHAALSLEWFDWSLDEIGNPFLIDTKDDTFQAPWKGTGIDRVMGASG